MVQSRKIKNSECVLRVFRNGFCQVYNPKKEGLQSFPVLIIRKGLKLRLVGKILYYKNKNGLVTGPESRFKWRNVAVIVIYPFKAKTLSKIWNVFNKPMNCNYKSIYDRAV